MEIKFKFGAGVPICCSSYKIEHGVIILKDEKGKMKYAYKLREGEAIYESEEGGYTVGL